MAYVNNLTNYGRSRLGIRNQKRRRSMSESRKLTLGNGTLILIKAGETLMLDGKAGSEHGAKGTRSDEGVDTWPRNLVDVRAQAEELALELKEREYGASQIALQVQDLVGNTLDVRAHIYGPDPAVGISLEGGKIAFLYDSTPSDDEDVHSCELNKVLSDVADYDGFVLGYEDYLELVPPERAPGVLASLYEATEPDLPYEERVARVEVILGAPDVVAREVINRVPRGFFRSFHGGAGK